MSAQSELKKLKAEKKELAKKAKALKATMDAGKEERKAQVKANAAIRKGLAENKTNLRKQIAEILPTMKGKDQAAIESLADALMETAATVAGSLRKFGESCKEDSA